MRLNSINSKVLLVIVIAFVISVFMSIYLADYYLKRIIDQAQSDVYSEKLDTVYGILDRSYAKLQATLMAEHYENEFQHSTIKNLQKLFYRSQDTHEYPFIITENGSVIMQHGKKTLDSSFVKKICSQKNGQFNYTDASNNRKWCMIKYFEPWKWLIVYSVPERVKYATLNRFINAFVIILVVISAVAITVLSLTITRFTKPIQALTKVASGMAEGKLDQELSVAGRDEIGLLTNSFIQMRNSIKEKIAELNKEIIDRKQAESALIQSEKKLAEVNKMLQIVLDTIPVRVFWKSKSLHFLGCNTLFVQDAGLEDSSELIGKDDFDMPWESMAEKYRKDDREVIDSQQPKLGYEESQVTKEGNTIWLKTSKVPLYDSDGQLVGLLGTYEDITDKHMLENQLRQSDKMQAIGQLAGGIAHDFNNMLSGIMGASELLSVKLEHDEKLHKLTHLINRSSQRAAELTQKLLDFSRKGKIQSTPVDIHSIIHDAIAILERSIDRRIQIDLQLDAELSMIIGDPIQMQNAILNIGVNARDAMSAGGVLTIATHNEDLSQIYCQTSTNDLVPGKYINISIKDTGIGMSDDIKERIFEPFYTTKGIGQGTGLGLAAVYGTVKDHRGSITVSSTVSSGTEFLLSLPVTEQDSVIQDSTKEDVIHGSGGILVIDDEAIVREMTTEMLEALGYDVFLAVDGVDGLKQYKMYQSEILLVILDLVMPSMNGQECFMELKKINPEVKVIMSSGFTQDVGIEQLKQKGLLDFIKKPFTSVNLSKYLAKYLK